MTLSYVLATLLCLFSTARANPSIDNVDQKYVCDKGPDDARKIDNTTQSDLLVSRAHISFQLPTSPQPSHPLDPITNPSPTVKRLVVPSQNLHLPHDLHPPGRGRPRRDPPIRLRLLHRPHLRRLQGRRLRPALLLQLPGPQQQERLPDQWVRHLRPHGGRGQLQLESVFSDQVG